jgi:hypothetical protein
MSKDTKDKLQDLATYGVSFSKGGKRIDPRDVYISTEPEQTEQEPLTNEQKSAEAELEQALKDTIDTTKLMQILKDGGILIEDGEQNEY